MKNKPSITKDILIEDLTNNYPFSVRHLMEKGIRCIKCGDPIWGTLEEAAKDKNFNDQAIEAFVEEMITISNNGDVVVGREKPNKVKMAG